MSAKPIAPDSGLQQLKDLGLEVEVRQQHLLVHSVPYVTTQRDIARATMVCKYMENGDSILAPNSTADNHQVWWAGSFPCRADGIPLTELVASTTEQPATPVDGCPTKFQFSNKPEEYMNTGYPDHFEKITHYVTLIESQARVIDPDATAYTRKIVEPQDPESVFRYADTASVRSEIVAVSNRLKGLKIGIVGTGGTGAYILDQVAKTPVAEIHLFDGDDFKQHNAFRAPGAATREKITAHLKKVDYFHQAYDPMHKGIVPHPYFIDAANAAELESFDFVFISVDKGPARKLVSDYLRSMSIPFVDVGMDVDLNAETALLDGTCRVTAGTKSKHNHLEVCLPTTDDNEDALYRKNIQIADLNALNAQLAVIKWKQIFGFYEDAMRAHQIVFSVATISLAREERSTGKK